MGWDASDGRAGGGWCLPSGEGLARRKEGRKAAFTLPVGCEVVVSAAKQGFFFPLQRMMIPPGVVKQQ